MGSTKRTVNHRIPNVLVTEKQNVRVGRKDVNHSKINVDGVVRIYLSFTTVRYHHFQDLSTTEVLLPLTETGWDVP